MNCRLLLGFFFLNVFLGFKNCYSQQKQEEKVDYSFSLDTTKTNIFPSDLEFNLKVKSNSENPLKYAYLFRLDKDKEVVPDRTTSLIKEKWDKLGLKDINNKITSDSLKFVKDLSKSNLLIEKWKKEKDVLTNWNDNTVKDSISCRLKLLTRNIKEHYYKVSYLDSINDTYKRKLFFKDKYNGYRINSSYPVEKINGDSLSIALPRLKPKSRYLIITANEGKKKSVIKKALFDYLKCPVLDTLEISIIPNKNLPKRNLRLRNSSKNFEKKFQEHGTVLKVFYNEESSPIEYNKSLGHIKHPGHYFSNNLYFDSTAVKEPVIEGYLKLNGFLSLNKKELGLISKGDKELVFDSIGRMSIQKVKSNSLNGRANQINKSKQQIFLAKQYLYFLAQKHPDSVKKHFDYFVQLENNINGNLEKIENKLENKKKIDSVINKMNLRTGFVTSKINNGTVEYNFLSRANKHIKPDFGLLHYFDTNSGLNGTTFYTGFHYDLRASNDAVPWSDIKDWKKHITFHVGVPFLVGDLIDDQRRKHLVGDTFSLYTGVGFNISHAVRISYGGLLFRAIDGESNQDINYKVKAVHTITLGVNLKLKSIVDAVYGTIQNAIKK